MNRGLGHIVFLAAVSALLFLITTRTGTAGGPPKQGPSVPKATARDDVAAAAAFKAIVPVLRHPRCMNCHSAGDYPRQGDDSHRHTMRIRRGPNGHGTNVVQCNS